jgi:diphthamide synthase subunit DPH2
MVEDEETRDKIDGQVMDYVFLQEDSFSNKMAKQNLEALSPSKWFLAFNVIKCTLQQCDGQVMDYVFLQEDSFSNKMAKQNLEALSPSKRFLAFNVIKCTLQQLNSSKPKA